MLIQIDLSNGLVMQGDVFTATTFKELNLKESDLEEFIRSNIQVLFASESLSEDEGENLLIVGQQATNVEGGRTDLIAVDEKGYLTLVELKRDRDDIKQRKEPFEFQAIRYAASLATITTPEKLVDLIYTPYIEKHRQHPEFSEHPTLNANDIARLKLDDFLKTNKASATFNKKQRIFLVASEFDHQTRAAVAWLIANNVDIACFTITPGKLLGQDFISIQKILPPPLLEKNYCEFRTPTATGSLRAIAASTTDSSRKILPRIADLMSAGLLVAGDMVSIRSKHDSQAKVEAKVVSSSQVEFQGKTMSFINWGKQVKGWDGFSVYQEVRNSHGRTLGELRQELSERQEKELRADESEIQSPVIESNP